MVLSERINELFEVNSSYSWEGTLCQKQTHSIEKKRRKKGRGKGHSRGGWERKGKKVKMSLNDSFSIKFCSFSNAHSSFAASIDYIPDSAELIKRSAEQGRHYRAQERY